MDELVKMVAKKTGLSEEMAETAVNMVLDYVKKKLPKPVAAQVDAVLGSGDALDALGGLFGGKK
jgi:nucleoid DNA-binding protein